MTKIRSFDWRDLPALFRYRHNGIFFDTAMVLTRGPLQVPAGALLSYFAPATGIFTYLCPDGDGKSSDPLLAQVKHDYGSSLAHLSFIAPEQAVESRDLPAVLEFIFTKIGERGAMHMIAEVDENSGAFEALRQASFAIYARQRIWQLTDIPVGESNASYWRTCRRRDLIPVRSLYHNLVPALVQQIEPQPDEQPRGLVYRQGDDLLAYVEVNYGRKGIWVQPFIHPDAEEVAARLVDLLGTLQNRRNRPVYLCVRSYQAWLDTALDEIGGEASPVQAVMVKHLAISKKVAQTFSMRALEGGHPEATAPLARSENKHKEEQYLRSIPERR